MKKNFLFAMAMAAVFAGCSSDDDGITQSNSMWDENGKGYVSFNLNLPTTPSTRANDNFDDGTAEEYAVKNATLILFSGDNEASAKIASAYTLADYNFSTEGTTTDNITVSDKLTTQINSVTGNKIYALVVLNHNGKFIVNETTNQLFDNASTDLSGKTLSELIEATTLTEQSNASAISGGDTKGILMANAVLSDKVGGTSNPTGANLTTLVEIDKAKIFTDRAASEAQPAATINVERAVAKVTVKKSDVFAKVDGTEIGYTVDGWMLDNTNKSTYLIRKAHTASIDYKSGNSTDYRFVGSAAIDGNSYRSYWAEDPNYGSFVAESFNTIGGTAPTEGWTDVDNSLYCLENTFNVENQKEQSTTRVIVKTVLTPTNKDTDGTFYMVNGAGDPLNLSGAEAAVKATFLERAAIINWFASNGKSGETLDASKLTVNWSTTEKGVKAVAGITVTDGLLKDGAETMPDVIADVNSITKITEFDGGVAYYPVLIRHFDDNQAPWKTWETSDVPSASDAYPGTNSEQNYLGRYGVLRNNWYELSITKITKVGFPVVPEVTTKTDDNLESYISVKINILSWAKRSQDVEL